MCIYFTTTQCKSLQYVSDPWPQLAVISYRFTIGGWPEVLLAEERVSTTECS